MLRAIPNFEGYLASSDGRVYSLYSNKYLPSRIYNSGYAYVTLKGRPRLLHRVIAMTFLPNPNNYPQVNHKDENKLNNCVDNLEWCSARYNVRYGKNAPLFKMINERKMPVAQLDKNGNTIATYESATEAQRATGIWQQNISRVCLHRKGYLTAGGYKWEFINQIK